LFSAAVRTLLSRARLARPAASSARPGSHPSQFESLEARALLSISQDAGGFTVVTPEAHSKVVYVSSSLGSDANDGLSAASPVKSLDYAKSLLRDGSGDQMLLARGDVWRESIGEWTKSGRSHDEPIVIGSYGAGPRPRLETGTRSAFSIISSKADVEHVALLGIDMVASARVPGSPDFVAGAPGGNGLRILSKVDDLLVEDCVVQAYEDNVLLQDYNAPQSNVTIRRSQVLDAYSTTDGHAQGLYAYGVRGLTLEENLFDHNGWSETVPGAPATVYNHNIYLSSNTTGVVVKGNVIANASSHGLQARGGGRIEDNVFLDNPIGVTFGVVKGASVAPGGVSGVINGNVFLGSRDIAGAGRGKGLEIGNTKPNIPTVVSNNIFAHANEAAGSDYAMLLSYAGDTDGEQAAGINDLTVQGNIVYRWTKGLKFDGALEPGAAGRFGINRVTVRGNDFQQVVDGRMVMHDSPMDPAQEKWEANRYDADPRNASEVYLGGKAMTLEKWVSNDDKTGTAAAAAFVDAGRSADTYAGVTTGAWTRGALLAAMRTDPAGVWRPQFTAAAMIDYIRGGFAEPGVAPRDWRAPTAPIAVAAVPATPTSGDAVVTFTVTYGDDKTIDLSTLDGGDVRLVGRKGKVDVPAAIVSVSGGGVEGQPVVVTYAASAPDGVWDKRDRGKYAVVAQERQVYDNEGFFVPAGQLEQFKLKVAPRPKGSPAPGAVDRPPTVTRASFNRKAQSLTVWFSEDVAGSISADDLVLGSEDGATTIDPSLTAVSYDTARRAATWTFPGLPGGALPAGKYRATILSAGLSDSAGQALDGNRDHAPGGDFVVKSPLKV
jgi:hypothetical protein